MTIVALEGGVLHRVQEDSENAATDFARGFDSCRDAGMALQLGMGLLSEWWFGYAPGCRCRTYVARLYTDLVRWADTNSGKPIATCTLGSFPLL